MKKVNESKRKQITITKKLEMSVGLLNYKRYYNLICVSKDLKV